MIYLIIFCLILVGVLHFDNKNRKLRSGTYYYWFCYVLLVLMFGLRYRVGGDTLNYLYKYSLISPLSELSITELLLIDLEPGFSTLMAFFRNYTEDFYGVQLVVSAITNFVWFKLIDERTSRRFLAIALYFVMYAFYFNTEIMRETLAVSFFVLAYKRLENGETLKYYLILSLGILFHYSCLFMLLVPILRNYLDNERKVIILMALFYVASTFAPYIIGNLSGYLLLKVERNLDYSLNVFGVISRFLASVFLPYWVGRLYRKYVDSTPNSGVQRFIYIYMLFGSLALGNFSILMRLANYMAPFFLVILTSVLTYVPWSKQRMQLVALCSLLYMVNIRGYFTDMSQFSKGARFYHIWYPYHSIVDEEEDPVRERVVRGSFDELREKMEN